MSLRQSDYSKVLKGKEALKITARSKIILPTLKAFAKELNLDKFDVKKVDLSSQKKTLKSIRSGWGKLTFPMKVGLSVGTLTTILFGGQSAGIAALGTAIGVPLWIVLGAGATFAATIYENIKGHKPDISKPYQIQHAEKDLTPRIKGSIQRFRDKRKNNSHL